MARGDKRRRTEAGGEPRGRAKEPPPPIPRLRAADPLPRAPFRRDSRGGRPPPDPSPASTKGKKGGQKRGVPAAYTLLC